MTVISYRHIGELVEPVATWNPIREESADTFFYVDLSAVDQVRKQITDARRVRRAEAPSRARQLVRSGDILVSTVRPNLNGVAKVPDELDSATASTGFCVLRPNSALLDSSFLFHWVKSPQFVSHLVSKATGASYPAVSDKIVMASRMPYVPVTDQRHIAAILDQADALRTKRLEALAQLDILTQSIFIEMFGDPIENPNGYKVSKLIELVDTHRPISYGILMPGPDVEGGVKYVRVVDMKNGGIELSGIRRTTAAMSNSFKRSLLRPGDLLMLIRGHVGRMAVIPEELDGANITQDSARLAISGANSIYVRECLRTPGFQRWMAKHTKGVAVRGINLGDVKLMPIPLPSQSMQDEFAKSALAIDKLMSEHKTAQNVANELFASLQHRAFRGEL